MNHRLLLASLTSLGLLVACTTELDAGSNTDSTSNAGASGASNQAGTTAGDGGDGGRPSRNQGGSSSGTAGTTGAPTAGTTGVPTAGSTGNSAGATAGTSSTGGDAGTSNKAGAGGSPTSAGGAGSGQAGSAAGSAGQGAGAGGSPSLFGGSAGTGGSGAGSGGSGSSGFSPGGSGGSSAGFGGSSGGSSGVDDCMTEAGCFSFRTPLGQGTPPSTSGGGAATGDENIQAVSRIFLGDTTREGLTSFTAWKDFGFDLDGWSSTPTQGFHCQPQTGGKAKNIRTDGANGIDNAFGAIIVNNVLASVLPDTSAIATESIQAGGLTTLIDVAALGAASNYASLSGSWLLADGTKQGSTPVAPPQGSWSSYAWHPVQGGGTTFSESYLTNNILVARTAQPMLVPIPLAGDAMLLPVQQARLSVDLTDRQNGVMGNLGGIIATEDMVASLKAIAGLISTSLCGDSPTFDGISKQIRAASDIMIDGTQDPTRVCNGISIGVGFSTKASSKGTSTTYTQNNPCAGL